MKKLIYFSTLILSAFIFTNCEKNEYTPAIKDISYIGFESGSIIELTATETLSKEIKVSTSTKTTGNRTFFIDVDTDLTNVDADVYSLPPSVTVLANKNTGSFNVDIYGEKINPNGKDSLAISFISSPDDSYLSNPIILRLKPKCPNPKFSIFITFDDGPGEVYWRLLDSNSDIVLESTPSVDDKPTYGAYFSEPEGGNFYLSECLDSGTYTFEMYDGGPNGDGNGDGAGPFDLSVGSDIEFSSDGDYGSILSTTIIIP